MNAVDTSMVVAAFASWHEGHRRATEVVALGARLPAHCAIESYSVLTRLPSPHRVAGALARDFLLSRFTEPLLTLDPSDHLALLEQLAEKAITGGAVYDGLVALTAARHGARLFSRDQRAAKVYEAMDVDFEIIA